MQLSVVVPSLQTDPSTSIPRDVLFRFCKKKCFDPRKVELQGKMKPSVRKQKD
jgi:hypothetical protein